MSKLIFIILSLFRINSTLSNLIIDAIFTHPLQYYIPDFFTAPVIPGFNFSSLLSIFTFTKK